ncbi:hypothetical protein WUBG_12981, partial [Wuchereria bancrofti]
MGACLCKRKRSSSGRNGNGRQHFHINDSSEDACSDAARQVRRRFSSRTQTRATRTPRTPSFHSVD